MHEVALPVLLAILSGVILLIVAAVKRARRSACRLAWLNEQHLLTCLSDLLKSSNEFVAVVVIDFGFGIEVWVTQNEDENTMLDNQKAIIRNGFRLYPNPTRVAVNSFCRDFGIKKVEIHTLFCLS